MYELGTARPSQLIYTFGIGALMDLPNISALIMGLDDWDPNLCEEVTENRLLATLKKRLGPQLKRLLLPPVTHDDLIFDPKKVSSGIPVCPFPRWFRCPVCSTLATIDSNVFKLELDPYRPDRTRYIHEGCTKATKPTALPVRFLLACKEGHLTDFPWIEYVHQGVKPCKPAILTLREFGASGDAMDIIVRCESCRSSKPLGLAFDRQKHPFKCNGHHPHLRIYQNKDCPENAQVILLGASNSWFPLVYSALSIPSSEDELTRLIESVWNQLREIPSLEVAKYVTAASRMPQLANYSAEEIWEAIQKKKNVGEKEEEEIEDLKIAEWQVFSTPDTQNTDDDFSLKEVDPPKGYESYFQNTVLVEKIREVRALVGFTRIESKGDFTDAAYSQDTRQAPLSRKAPQWVPVSEVRGEGIFIRLRESVLQDWERKKEVVDLAKEFLQSHTSWRMSRRLDPPEDGFPGIRYVLIHSLSHAIMRQIVLDCGYTAASIRERIYSRVPEDKEGPMAGILIYTSASDSEGTLGGLVDLGKPISLGRHIQQVLENLRICASDPLCSENRPGTDARGIHGACCHACLFSPETSCEHGNRYLDRNTLVQTFIGQQTHLFDKE